MTMKKGFATFGLLVTLLMTSLCTSTGSAQIAASALSSGVSPVADQPSATSGTNVDLRALKSQMEAFDSVLDRSIQQNFQQPFSLLQDAKGSYLPGFGVAFHLEVNLLPLRLQMPFDARPYSPEELRKGKEAKLERIHQLKSHLSAFLLEHGGSLSAVAPDQNMAIVVHLFNMPSEARDLPTQLVITVTRQMLLDYQNGRFTAEQLQKTGSVLEF
jgi:hypothetical protein